MARATRTFYAPTPNRGVPTPPTDPATYGHRGTQLRARIGTYCFVFVIARDENNKQKQDLRQGEYAVDDEDVVVESLDINIAEVENKDEVETRLLMEVGMEFTQQSIWEFDWHQCPWTIKLPTGQLVNRVIARSNPIKP